MEQDTYRVVKVILLIVILAGVLIELDHYTDNGRDQQRDNFGQPLLVIDTKTNEPVPSPR